MTPPLTRLPPFQRIYLRPTRRLRTASSPACTIAPVIMQQR
jgi:hypothetical protein